MRRLSPLVAILLVVAACGDAAPIAGDDVAGNTRPSVASGPGVIPGSTAAATAPTQPEGSMPWTPAPCHGDPIDTTYLPVGIVVDWPDAWVAYPVAEIGGYASEAEAMVQAGELQAVAAADLPDGTVFRGYTELGSAEPARVLRGAAPKSLIMKIDDIEALAITAATVDEAIAAAARGESVMGN